MIKLTGAAKIVKAVKTRAKRADRNKEFIFIAPLKPILSEIRKNVIKDSFSDGRSHVFTGDLLRSIGTEFGAAKFGPYDYNMRIKFGYFIKYGLDLELGSDPETIAIPRLQKWIKKRLGNSPNTFSRAKGLKKKIKSSGTTAYPIIQPIWAAKRDEYFKEVRRRFAKQWL
jgi:hypothetical protein